MRLHPDLARVTTAHRCAAAYFAAVALGELPTAPVASGCNARSGRCTTRAGVFLANLGSAGLSRYRLGHGWAMQRLGSPHRTRAGKPSRCARPRHDENPGLVAQAVRACRSPSLRPRPQTQSPPPLHHASTHRRNQSTSSANRECGRCAVRAEGQRSRDLQRPVRKLRNQAQSLLG